MKSVSGWWRYFCSIFFLSLWRERGVRIDRQTHRPAVRWRWPRPRGARSETSGVFSKTTLKSTENESESLDFFPFYYDDCFHRVALGAAAWPLLLLLAFESNNKAFSSNKENGSMLLLSRRLFPLPPKEEGERRRRRRRRRRKRPHLRHPRPGLCLATADSRRRRRIRLGRTLRPAGSSRRRARRRCSPSARKPLGSRPRGARRLVL